MLGYDRVACYDPKTGEKLGDYTEVRRALEAAQKRTAAAIEARKKDQRRIAAAIEARKKDERLTAVAVKARKKAEILIAVEAEASAKAEARIRELEAALARLDEPSGHDPK